jgi:hypothetical protein
LGLAALVGLALAAIAAGAAWALLKSGLISLERSRQELSRNIAWLKSTLRSRGEASSPQRTTRI